MGCITRSAFWLASIGLALLLGAYVLPLWLGRHTETSDSINYTLYNTVDKLYIGLFYRISCVSVLCDVEDQVLSSESVALEGQEEWNLNIVAVPVLVTISLFFSVLACIILEAIRCGFMYGRHRIRRVLALCAFILLVSAIFGTLGLFIAMYMADKYYEHHPISHAGEFPWAILVLVFAMILIIMACIFYFVISCRWYRYCHYYGCRTPWYVDEPDGGKAGLYTVNRNSSRLRSSSRRDSPPTSGYGGGVPSFVFNGISRNEGSTYYEPKRSSSYSDFRASKPSKKYSSAGDLRYTIHDSPSIMRSSRMPEFIKDENDFLRQSRKSGYGSGIDPSRLSTRDAYDNPMIRHSHSDMDLLRNTRTEPSVLDILYRESRKSKY